MVDSSERQMTVKVDLTFDTNYPKVPTTMEERIKAVQVARPLLSATTPISSSAATSTDLVYLAEYIATGHTYYDTHPEKLKPSKKDRRKAAKELRRMVQEEVEEELDRRASNAKPGTEEEKDGAQTPMADFVRQQQGQEKATWPDGILEEDGSTTDTKPEDDEWIPKGETRDA